MEHVLVPLTLPSELTARRARGEPGQISRHPLGDALRTREEPQNPHRLRALSDYVLVRSPFKSKMWVYTSELRC